MAHSLTTASHSSACAELGISVGANRTQTSLTRHATINKWSFYRPGSIAPNASDFVTLTAPSANDKLGDFRGYNHSATAPYTPADFNVNWGPGGTYATFEFLIYLNELNIKELFPSSTPYITVKYYLTTTARDSQTGALADSYTVAVALTTNSPPTGHTNNQTQKLASSTQLVSDTTFQVASIVSPNDIVYCDIFFSDSSGNQVVRFGSALSDGHVDVNTHERQYPWVDSVGTCVTRSGYTGCHTEINNVASSCTGADVALIVGSTAYSFYLRAVGIASGTYNINPTNCTVRIRHYASDGVTIKQTITLTSQNLNTSSKNGKQFSGNVTNSFNYDEFLKVDITTVSSWGTAYAC